MSRIDDDNSDDQRIREMNEAALREKIQRDKRDDASRVTRSFKEVMDQRTGKKASEEQSADAKTKDRATKLASERSGKDRAQEKLPRQGAEGREQARRAALSRSLARGLAKTRTSDAEATRDATLHRSDDMTRSADEERDRIAKDLRARDDEEIAKEEERRAEKTDEAAHEGRVDDDDGRHGGRRRHAPDEKKGEDEGVEALAPASDVAMKSRPQAIPPELIAELVSKMYAAFHTDGRTELQLELKGTLLDGVRIKVTANKGKVRCSFEGCNKGLRDLLESARGGLTRALAKKGMDLVSMTVK